MAEYEMNWKGNKFSTISFSITERISVIFLESFRDIRQWSLNGPLNS